FRFPGSFLFVFQMGVFPAVNAAVTVFGNFRPSPRLALELDLSRFGHVDLELLVEYDAAVLEVVTGRELSGRQRIHDGSDKLVLEHIARPQRRYGNVLLVIVGVNRRVGNREVLDRRLLRGDHGPIWLDDADIDDLELVTERAIADLQLSQRLHSAVAVDLDARVDLLATSAVTLEAKGLEVMLNHERFLRVIGRFGQRRLGSRSRLDFLRNGSAARFSVMRLLS